MWESDLQDMEAMHVCDPAQLHHFEEQRSKKPPTSDPNLRSESDGSHDSVQQNKAARRIA